jgi:hypothetical protein
MISAHPSHGVRRDGLQVLPSVAGGELKKSVEGIVADLTRTVSGYKKLRSRRWLRASGMIEPGRRAEFRRSMMLVR